GQDVDTAEEAREGAVQERAQVREAPAREAVDVRDELDLVPHGAQADVRADASTSLRMVASTVSGLTLAARAAYASRRAKGCPLWARCLAAPRPRRRPGGGASSPLSTRHARPRAAGGREEGPVLRRGGPARRVLRTGERRARGLGLPAQGPRRLH